MILSKMSKVLILGATGFLGSRLAVHLIKRNYDVTLIGRTPKTTPKIIKDNIIHIEIENLNEEELGSFDKHL